MDKIKFHNSMKNQLEKKIDGMEFDETAKIREEIAFNEKMLEIWQRNEEKLRRQMSEMEE